MGDTLAFHTLRGQPACTRQANESDALIAATALVHGLTVVTRNVGDFQSSGVALINPWEQ